jgi:hypothetical protein
MQYNCFKGLRIPQLHVSAFDPRSIRVRSAFDPRSIRVRSAFDPRSIRDLIGHVIGLKLVFIKEYDIIVSMTATNIEHHAQLHIPVILYGSDLPLHGARPNHEPSHGIYDANGEAGL